jgi:hypothetical protein
LGGNAVRLGIAVVVLALAVEAAGPSPASARSAKADAGVVLKSFELDGSNGYALEVVQGAGPFLPSIEVSAERDGLRASYEVPADRESGMHAVFGSLGSASLDFSRRKRSVDHRGRGCVWITETGVFRGDFSFSGEDGYTTAAASSVRGEVVRLPQGFCGLDDRIHLPFAIPEALRETQLSARAAIPHGFVALGASLTSGPHARARVTAFTQERVGAMKISRSATAVRHDAFTVGPGKRPRFAEIAPPAPFSGSATFRAPPGQKPTLTGSLSVSLPGVPETSLAGEDFSVRLCPRASPFAECRAPGHLP